MKLVKSLLLGSAAGLAAVAGAQAADLPVRAKAPAVEYVRVCTAYGAGFFFIPGTDTCLRVGGRVRAEFRVTETFDRRSDAVGFLARGRLNIDTRTATAFGTLRAFFRYELTGVTGNYASTAPVFAANTNANFTTANVDKAFIQFAGITAGRSSSFFDFYANDLNYQSLRGSDSANQNLFAYTATFGSGFSATISVEDAFTRRVNAAAFNNGAPVFAGLPAGLAAQTFVSSGQTLPDIVGSLRVDQSWGSAQLSAAVHQNRPANFLPAAFGPVRDFAETEYGFAVQAGVKFNLPMIAPGDVLWLQAAYADGAASYLGVGGSGFGNTSIRLGGTVPNGVTDVFLQNQTDAFVDAFGNTRTSSGFAAVAAFLHYWAPNLRQGVYGSYLSLDYPASATGFVTSPATSSLFGTSVGFVDTEEFRVGTNLIYSPVKDLDIGAEVFYVNVDPKGRVATTIGGVGGNLLVGRSSIDAFEGRLRIQRDF